jgi:hypothetical protein
VEQDKKNTLIIIALGIVVYALKFAFTVLPKTTVLYSPFPYDPQEMTRPTYLDMVCDCVSYVCIFGVLCYILPKYREVFFMLALAFTGYAIEFAFKYNNPMSKFYFTDYIYLPIGYSTFAWTFLIVIFFYKLFSK